MNLRDARERYIKAERAVNRTFEPTQAQWNEFDDAAKAVCDAEQREQDRLYALTLR